MIFHTVRFSFREDADPAAVERTLDALRRLGRELPGVTSFVVGRDVGGRFDQSATFVLPDVRAYRTYMYAPLHRRIDDMGMPLLSEMESFDITDDPDPAITDRLRRIHEERYAGDPELVEMIGRMDGYTGSGITGPTPGPPR